jgi:hypothetical protein
MSILIEVLKELLSMFLADARLTGAVLVLVGAVALAINRGGVDPLLGGAGLLVGCLAILGVVTALQARRR